MPVKKIVNQGEEINVKRFYLDEIKVKCPNCGADAKMLGDNYLSYPTIGEEEEATGYCGNCESCLTMPVKVRIQIEYDYSKITFEKESDYD